MVLLAGIPDLLTAAAFLAVWMHTEWFGPQWVATGMTTMLLEFFVVHASGFYAVVMYGGERRRSRRVLYLAGLAALYLLLLSGYAWAFHAWWMIGAFFWLTVGKMLTTWNVPTKGSSSESDQSMLAMGAWALSVVVYLAAVIAGSTLDVPAYGVTPEVTTAAGFDLNSSGEWESKPYCALAGGVVYFGAMGVLRTLLRLLLPRKKEVAAVL